MSDAPSNTRPQSNWIVSTYGEPLTDEQRADFAAAVQSLKRLTRKQLQMLKAEVIPQIQRRIPAAESEVIEEVTP
jgi:hypothetical protein